MGEKKKGGKMGKRYELKIHVINSEYVNTLIVSLVRQGYNVYYNEDEKVVCCTITEDELEEIKK